jgi:hypothetical protein
MRNCLIERLESRTVPSSLTVQNLDDSGVGSFRAAIEQANLDQAQDTITFASGLSGKISLSSALPDVAANLIIAGPGASVLAIASSVPFPGTFRILDISPGASVVVSGLTISNGGIPGGDNINNGRGGGIYNAGKLALVDTTIRDNVADFSGGGIDNEGTLTIVNSMVTNNGCGLSIGTGSGGGIYNHGALTLFNSTIQDNKAIGAFGDGVGGGIYNAGTLTVVNTTIADNHASSSMGGGYGGGIENAGTLAIANSTISGNGAGGRGQASGGGIDNSGTVIVADSTINDNSSSVGLGGSGGNGNNASGSLVCVGSILSSPGISTGSFQSLGHNLFAAKSAVAVAPTDLVGTDPMLGPLADHGGPTWTEAILPGSPAINAGATIPGMTTDQRGLFRPQGAGPDIGAYELQLPPVVVSVQRFGVHYQPTTLTIKFSQPMSVASVEALTSYTLVSSGPDHRFGTRDDQAIRIRSVHYDSAANTVTLSPIRRLPLQGTYQLTIHGAPATGLKDTAGLYLDGAGKQQQGSNYVARITAKLLVPPIAQNASKQVRIPNRLRWR